MWNLSPLQKLSHPGGNENRVNLATRKISAVITIDLLEVWRVPCENGHPSPFGENLKHPIGNAFSAARRVEERVDEEASRSVPSHGVRVREN